MSYAIEEIIGNKPVLIWGARALGCGVCKMVQRANRAILGFVDSDPCFRNKKILGYTVYSPDQLKDLAFADVRPFIIIASSLSEDVISEKCVAIGLKKEFDFCSVTKFCDCEYIIDIVGACNLKCPSCPRGNFRIQPKAGTISVDTFRLVVVKILTETPNVNSVSLYNWGEPFLHPQLADLIGILREHKIFCSLSTNFNIRRDFEDVIRACPDMLKVSVSGYYQDSYGKTHTAGNINLVKSNLYKLRYLMDIYAPGLMVEIIYHKYKHNVKEDYDRMQQLCEELNFQFASVYAYLSPVEKVIDYVEGKLLDHDKKFTDMLSVNIGDALKISQSKKSSCCPLLNNQIVINWDTSVSLCCASFDPDKTIVHNNFLSTTTEEIKKAKIKNALCNKCMKYGVHQYYFETAQCVKE